MNTEFARQVVKRAAWALALSVVPLSNAVCQQGDADWKRVLEAAKQEGEVIVWGQAGEGRRAFYKDSFEKAYPGIKVNLYQAPLNSQRDNRYEQEYKAGIFRADLFVTGPSSAVTRFMPINLVQPLKPLLRADVLDPKHWTSEGGPLWLDRKKQYVLIGDALTYPTATVNSSVTNLSTYEDLLLPKYDGKIVMSDPLRSGSGFAFALFLDRQPGLGREYIRKFFKGKRIVFNQDDRAQTEWVDSGRVLVGLNLRASEIVALQELGGTLKIIGPLAVGNEKVGFTIGSDGVLWLPALNPLPHPNAARVYANWFYSTAGQQSMVNALDLGSNVAGVDLSKVSRWSLPQPGVRYLNLMTEDIINAEETASLRKFIEQVLAQ